MTTATSRGRAFGTMCLLKWVLISGEHFDKATTISWGSLSTHDGMEQWETLRVWRDAMNLVEWKGDFIVGKMRKESSFRTETSVHSDAEFRNARTFKWSLFIWPHVLRDFACDLPQYLGYSLSACSSNSMRMIRDRPITKLHANYSSAKQMHLFCFCSFIGLTHIVLLHINNPSIKNLYENKY